MLLFFDESYDDDENGNIRHAYAGFAISQERYRALVAALYQRKQRYFVHDVDFSAEDREEARRSGKILVSVPAEQVEIKADKLLTDKQAKFHAEHGKAPGLLLVEELLNVMADADCTVFASLSTLNSMHEVQSGATYLPPYLTRILERVEQFMQEQHPNQSAVIVLDRVKDDHDKHLSELSADFLFRSAAGKRMRHIVPNVFWVDSKTTAGSQVADVLAHLLMNSMRPDAKRKQLDHLWRKVVAMEYHSTDLRTRGIRKIKQQTGA